MAALVLIAAAALYRKGNTSYAVAAAAMAVIFTAVAAAIPSAMKPLRKLWMGMAAILGWLMTRVILIIMFFLIMTPMALLLRLLRKDLLKLSRTSDPTYWIRINAPENDK